MLDDLRAFYANTQEWQLSTLQSVFNNSIQSNKFISVSMSKKQDVYGCLKKFFGLKEEGNK